MKSLFGIETFRNEVIDLNVILSMKVVAGAVQVESWGEGVVGGNRTLLCMHPILSQVLMCTLLDFLLSLGSTTNYGKAAFSLRQLLIFSINVTLILLIILIIDNIS